MHQFSELVYQNTAFTLSTLGDVESKAIEQLQTSGGTQFVKTLQMIQLQKAIIAIGIFSLFESILQNGLSCKNGFDEAKTILKQTGKNDLNNQLEYFICAINVLKHGKGRSYNELIAKYSSLPFRIKLPGEAFFNEGDVSEVSTLIQANDEFVLNCAKLIEDITEEIKKSRKDFLA